jgi:quercetin dioxygenase-like cupin family protein
MGTLNSEARTVSLSAVPPTELPGGSWSRMVLTEATIPEATSSLGYSVFRPGTATALVSHTVEELAFVVEGSGELRLEAGVVPFQAGDALFVPRETWHAVANTGERDVVMVFTFPYPAYPPTERR